MRRRRADHHRGVLVLLGLAAGVALVHQRVALTADATPEARVAQVLQLLHSPHLDARLAGLEWVKRDPSVQTKACAGPVLQKALTATDVEERQAAVRNLVWVRDRLDEPKAVVALMAAAEIGGATSIRNALGALEESAKNGGRMCAADEIPTLIVHWLTNDEASVRERVLKVVQAAAPLRERADVLTAVTKALEDSARGNRVLAADVLASALREGGEHLPDVVTALRSGLGAGGAQPVSAAKAPLAATPSFESFAKHVEPLLVVRSMDDHAACVTCHTTHALFRLAPPSLEGQFTGEQSRQNYLSALKVFNPNDPEDSPILWKPLSSRGRDALGHQHCGGKRWGGGPDSPEYRVILSWLTGQME